MERVTDTAVAIAGLVAVLLAWPAGGSAQEDDRPTIQQRFATKSGSMYAHAMATTQVRNDFYDSIGLGVDVGWYPGEHLGLEGRWAYLFSSLSPAARDVKEETGLTPDARPQHMLATIGARWSFGYGKVLVMEESVVHFDPQMTFHGGVALAEKRVLPTATVGLSLLTHFVNGFQAKLDLATAIQFEQRQRGWVPSFGFMPTLGVGWGGNLQDLAEVFTPEGGEG